MQNSKHIIIRAALAVWLALPVAAQAQSSSLNAFSPYTFYGLGDFSTQGPAYMRSMGGVGVGYRNSMKINYINPASYSLLGRKTFLFNVGIEGNNTYSKTAEAKTSHNSFNVRDIALAMPLGRGVGSRQRHAAEQRGIPGADGRYRSAAAGQRQVCRL